MNCADNLFLIYPNPATSSSVIYYSLANSTDVTIEVANNLGEKVLLLVNTQHQNEGKYKYEFSLKDAGIYFVKMQTEQGVSVKRLIYIK